TRPPTRPRTTLRAPSGPTRAAPCRKVQRRTRTTQAEADRSSAPGAEQGRAAARPHHEPALTPPPAQPVEGVAAEREGDGGVDVGPHQVGPDDRDRGDPGRC